MPSSSSKVNPAAAGLRSPLILVFDTETSGFPAAGGPDAHIMQLAAVLVRAGGAQMEVVAKLCTLVRLPAGAFVHPKAAAVTGLSAARCNAEGRAPAEVWREFSEMAGRASAVVGHNIEFDLRMAVEFCRIHGLPNPVAHLPSFCTMKLMTPHCKIPGKYKGSYKWPTCAEAYRFVMNGATFDNAHDALADVLATVVSLSWLYQRRLIRLPEPELTFVPLPTPAPPAPAPAPSPLAILKTAFSHDRRPANC